MKSLIFSGLLLLSGLILLAQEDIPFYYFNKEYIAEKTIYNAKDEVVAQQRYNVVELYVNEGKAKAEGRNIKIKSNKEEEETFSLFTWDGNCMKMAMGKSENGEDVFLDYPIDMKIRDNLVTGLSFETEATVAGKKLKIYSRIDNRVVLAVNQKVTTSLDSWNCVMTGYDMELKCKVLGIGIPVKVYVIEWFSGETGIVRTEVYRNGKLQERRELTGFRSVEPDKLSLKDR